MYDDYHALKQLYIKCLPHILHAFINHLQTEMCIHIFQNSGVPPKFDHWSSFPDSACSLRYQPFFRQNCITAISIWTRQLLGYFHWNKTFSSLILKDSCTLYIQYTQIQSYPMYSSQSPVLYIRLYLYIYYMDKEIYIYTLLYTYPGVCGFVEGNPLVDNFPHEQVPKQHDWWTYA